jgi:hypothetical protein
MFLEKTFGVCRRCRWWHPEVRRGRRIKQKAKVALNFTHRILPPPQIRLFRTKCRPGTGLLPEIWRQQDFLLTHGLNARLTLVLYRMRVLAEKWS